MSDYKIGDVAFDKFSGRSWMWNGNRWQRLVTTMTLAEDGERGGGRGGGTVSDTAYWLRVAAVLAVCGAIVWGLLQVPWGGIWRDMNKPCGSQSNPCVQPVPIYVGPYSRPAPPEEPVIPVEK